MKSHILISKDRIKLKRIIQLYGINFLANVVTGKQILMWRFNGDIKYADIKYWEKLSPYFDSILFEDEWRERQIIDDKIRSRLIIVVEIYGYKHLINKLSLSCNSAIKNWIKPDSIFITKITWGKLLPYLNSTIYRNDTAFYLPHLDPRISDKSIYDINYRWKIAENKNVNTIVNIEDNIDNIDIDESINDYVKYHELMEQFEQHYLKGTITKQQLNNLVNKIYLDDIN